MKAYRIEEYHFNTDDWRGVFVDSQRQEYVCGDSHWKHTLSRMHDITPDTYRAETDRGDYRHFFHAKYFENKVWEILPPFELGKPFKDWNEDAKFEDEVFQLDYRVVCVDIPDSMVVWDDGIQVVIDLTKGELSW